MEKVAEFENKHGFIKVTMCLRVEGVDPQYFPTLTKKLPAPHDCLNRIMKWEQENGSGREAGVSIIFDDGDRRDGIVFDVFLKIWNAEKYAEMLEIVGI